MLAIYSSRSMRWRMSRCPSCNRPTRPTVGDRVNPRAIGRRVLCGRDRRFALIIGQRGGPLPLRYMFDDDAFAAPSLSRMITLRAPVRVLATSCC